MLRGFATAEGTKEYAQRHPELEYGELGLGWSVSQAGFGGYRVDEEVETHRAALRKALQGGVNVIDTSSNYADGGSERLVGRVLAEMEAAGEIRREEVVVVTKGGYLQGRNYALSQERKAEGRPFSELVEYAEGLEHCLHPEFVEDQVTRSLERLGMETADVYLLHNPEYYLSWCKKNGVAAEAARAEYERRLEAAFRQLEREVERGRIRCYGISSNTFPTAEGSYEHTSLRKVWELAEKVSAVHHLRVIQLPMNLMETGGVTEEPSVVEEAKRRGIGVLINRPLNAVRGNAIFRLAEVPGAEGQEAALIETIPGVLAELGRLEAAFRTDVLAGMTLTAAEREKLADRLALGRLLGEHGRQFASLEHWQEVQGQFLIPTVQQGVQAVLAQEGAVEGAREWVLTYVEQVNEALRAFAALYRERAMREVETVRAAAAEADAEWAQAPTLRAMALRALRSTAGVSTVLVGMRRAEYVEDVLAELKREVRVMERKRAWRVLEERLGK